MVTHKYELSNGIILPEAFFTIKSMSVFTHGVSIVNEDGSISDSIGNDVEVVFEVFMSEEFKEKGKDVVTTLVKVFPYKTDETLESQIYDSLKSFLDLETK